MRLKTAHKNRNRKAWRAWRAILAARLNAVYPTPPTLVARLIDAATLKPSPESTGVYECLCGNTRDFIGIDANGYGGREECECVAQDDPELACECLTELRQPFTVIDGEVDHAAFEGGGPGSDIGNYTSIVCARCKTVIWKEGER